MKTTLEIVTRLKKLKKRELSNPDYDLDEYEDDIELYGETIYSELNNKLIFEDAEGAINLDNVNLMDIYMTRYRGINIFFMVSKTRCHKAALFELETKLGHCVGEENSLYETLTKDFKPRKQPYIIEKNNCWTKTDYWVRTDTGDGCIRVQTKPSSPICQLDVARGRVPKYTTLICKKIPVQELIKHFNSLSNTPFPVDNLADWLKENEIVRKEKVEA